VVGGLTGQDAPGLQRQGSSLDTEPKHGIAVGVVSRRGGLRELTPPPDHISKGRYENDETDN